MRLLSSRSISTWFLRMLIVFLFLLPLLWMISAAFQSRGQPLSQNLRLFSSRITFENFIRVWQVVPLGRFLLNSLQVVALAVPITLLTSSWAGLGISQLPRPSQRRWIFISLALLMVPGISLWSTRFFVYKALGLYNTVWALIAPAWMGTSPFYVLMFYRAFRRLSPETYQSARLDGADVLQIWWFVALPIARPTVVGVALLSFIYYWGDFISPLLYLQSEKKYTISIALQLLQQMNRSDWPLLMAAAVISTIVPVVLFLFLQPFFARLSWES